MKAIRHLLERSFNAIAFQVILASSSMAAPISWTSSPATTSGSVGQTLNIGIFSSGTAVYAENTGGGVLVFDGINFAAGTLGFAGGGSYNGFHEGGWPSQSGAYGSSGPSTITLGTGSMPALVVGEQYTVQLLVFDGRASSNGRAVSVDGIAQGVYANGIDGVTWGNGRIITGTFTADATTQAFTLESFASVGGASVGPQLNALLLTTPPPPTSLYADWETANGIAGAGANSDSDNDGIANGIEFVIGGDPSGPDSNSNALLVPPALDATCLNFVFRRTSASVSLNPSVEYGSDLATWTPADPGVPVATPVIITEGTDFYGDGIDRVTVSIPRVLATDGKLFARLMVEITP